MFVRLKRRIYKPSGKVFYDAVLVQAYREGGKPLQRVKHLASIPEEVIKYTTRRWAFWRDINDKLKAAGAGELPTEKIAAIVPKLTEAEEVEAAKTRAAYGLA